MTGTATLPTDMGSALALHEEFHTWTGDPLTSRKSQQLELSVTRAVQLAAGLRLVWPLCTQEGSVWETEYYRLRLRAVELLALTVLDILTRAQQTISSTRAKYPEWVVPAVATEVQPGLETTREVLGNVQSLLQWLERPRRSVDEELIRRSQDSLNRGEGEAIGDLIARVENGGLLVKE